VSVSATFSVDDVSLQINASALISARILSGGRWSALTRVGFIGEQTDFSSFRVTEVHYHPPDLITVADTTDGQDLEFMEFKNTGLNSINLSGLVIDSAIHYSFPNDILLAPRQFWVIALNLQSSTTITEWLPRAITRAICRIREVLITEPEQRDNEFYLP
jgi:hypothetical protein